MNAQVKNLNSACGERLRVHMDIGYLSDCPRFRYDLGGIPLPFSGDELYKQLFPLLPGSSGLETVTKSVFNVQDPSTRRGYDPTSIPSCPHCDSRRVFECQLMPNLINIIGSKR
jgi:pre-rRNA-processing protein TSR4